jgi:hypothetical protein
MALAESMRKFVNDLKASRRSRHGFVKGNRENARNLMAENRKYLQKIHEQNKSRGDQTRAFLKSSKETRMQTYKQTMDDIRNDIKRIHQAKEAITQGAREMLKEFRSDNQLAHKYWASLTSSEPIADPRPAAATTKSAKKDVAKGSGASQETKQTKSPVREAKSDEIKEVKKGANNVDIEEAAKLDVKEETKIETKEDPKAASNKL